MKNNIYKLLGLIMFMVTSLNITTAQYEGMSSYLNQKMVAPPSPQAAGFSKSSDFNVNHFTGALNLNIPVHSLGGRGIGHSVSLSYNGSGNKLDQVPTWVGLGWNLNAGGVISRTVMGNPDSDANYFNLDPLVVELAGGNTTFTTSYSTTCGIGTTTDLYHAYTLFREINVDNRETMPDLYTLNAGGINSTFIIAQNGDVIQKERTGLKIEYIKNYTRGPESFVVTDQNGYIYIFEGVEVTQVIKTDTDFFTNAPNTYNSSVYLTEIISPTTSETITFNYETLNDYDNRYYLPFQSAKNHYTTKGKIGGALCGGNIAPSSSNTCETEVTTLDVGYDEITIWDRHFLQTIIRKIGNQEVESLEFIKDDHTLGVDGDQLLETIILRGSDDQNPIKQWEFKYNNTDPTDVGRLLLKEFKENSVMGGSGVQSNPYIFNYYDETLEDKIPFFNSGSIDHWGYQNNSIFTTNMIPNVFINNVLGAVGEGASRSSNLDNMKRGMLQKITYPTSGTSNFEYELHETFSRNPFNPNDDYEDRLGGGLRIMSIVDKDYDNTQVDKTTYHYTLNHSEDSNSGGSSGKLFSEVNYVTKSNFYTMEQVVGGGGTTIGAQWGPNFGCSKSIVSATANNLKSIQGSFVGYSRVEVKKTGIGKTVYNYKLLTPNSINGFTENYFGEFEDGELEMVQVYNSSNRLEKEVKSFYTSEYDYSPYSVTDPGLIVYPIPTITQSNEYQICHYIEQGIHKWVFQLESGSFSTQSCIEPNPSYEAKTRYKLLTRQANTFWKYMHSSETTNFFYDTDNMVSGTVKSTQTYTYDNEHITAPTSQSVNNSDGKIYRTEITYPHNADLASLPNPGMVGDIADLKNNHIHAEPIMKKHFVDDVFQGGTYKIYSYVRPILFYHIFHSNGQQMVGRVTSYDPKGFPRGYQQFNHNFFHPETYKWDLGRITEIKKGIQYSNFSYYTGTNFVKNVTNSDGMVAFYEYDELWRLKDQYSKIKFSGTNTTLQIDEADSYNVHQSYNYLFGSPNVITGTTQFADGTPSQTSVQTLDGHGRPLTTTVNGQLKDAVEYDNLGRILQKTYLPGNFQSFVYEDSPLGRVVEIKYPDGNSIFKKYDHYESSYFKNTMVNENGNPTSEISDLFGRTFKTIDALDFETTHLYDNRGNLVEVQPPNFNETNESYKYTFNVKNLLIKKIIPGGGVHSFRYNTVNQLVASRNPKIKEEGRWMINNYDFFGRVKRTGFYKGNSLPSDWNNIIPTWVLTENYYDDYSSIPSGALTYFGGQKCDKPIIKGKLVGSLTRVIDDEVDDSDDFLESCHCYDDYGRVIENKSSNLGGGVDVTNNVYNFADNPTQIRTSHEAFSNNIIIDQTLEYDNFQRMDKNFLKVGNLPEVLVTKNLYNNKGQLTNKWLGGDSQENNFLQSINYQYNSRGWLTHINDVVPNEGEIIGECETDPINCGPKCDYSVTYTLYGDDSVIGINYGDNSQLNGNSIQQIPLPQGYTSSQSDLDALKNDLEVWMLSEGYAFGEVVISATSLDETYDNKEITLSIYQTNVPYYSLQRYSDQDGAALYFDKTNCINDGGGLLGLIDPNPGSPFNIKAEKPISVKMEYNHETLSKNGKSIIFIQENSTQLLKDGKTRNNIRSKVIPFGKERNLDYERTHIIEIKLNTPWVSNYNQKEIKKNLKSQIQSELKATGISTQEMGKLTTTILSFITNDWDKLPKADPVNSDGTTNPPDLFSMKLIYGESDPMISSAPQYNSNISGVLWQAAGRSTQSYGFSYDDNNRLTKGEYKQDMGGGIFSANDDYGINITYKEDGMGNIESMKRRGVVDICFPNDGFDPSYEYGDIDNMVYSYTKNRLTNIDEDGTANDPSLTNNGYKGIGGSYSYDSGGNMISDDNKELTITYNYMNLPRLIETPQGTITLTYDAVGNKLIKEVAGTNPDGSELNYVRHYIGGIEYKDEYLESIYHSEGRVLYEAVSEPSDPPKFEYHLRDHLGNTRVVFSDLNGSGFIETTDNPGTVANPDPNYTEVLQVNHYYPFGMEMDGIWTDDFLSNPENKYTYNGKELNSDFDLNWSDYGARWYDGSIGRWNAVDPLAGAYSSWNPYNYTLNNPIKFIDPDGMRVSLFERMANQVGRTDEEQQSSTGESGSTTTYSGEKAVKFLRENFAVKGSVKNYTFKLDLERVTSAGENGNITSEKTGNSFHVKVPLFTEEDGTQTILSNSIQPITNTTDLSVKVNISGSVSGLDIVKGLDGIENNFLAVNFELTHNNFGSNITAVFGDIELGSSANEFKSGGIAIFNLQKQNGKIRSIDISSGVNVALPALKGYPTQFSHTSWFGLGKKRNFIVRASFSDHY